jgi:hypothetical protein
MGVEAMNAKWHEKHPLGRGKTLEERIRWHREHAELCGCREIPKSILAELKKRAMAAASTKGRNPQKSRRSKKPKKTKRA